MARHARSAVPARVPFRSGIASFALCVAALAVAASAPPPARAADGVVTPDAPVRISTSKADRTRLVGRVSSYSQTGFDLLDDAGKSQRLKWSDLPPRSAMEVYGVLLAKATPAEWAAAGQVLYHLPDGKEVGDRAFARALRADPKLKDEIEVLRRTPPAPAAGGGELLGRPGEVAGRNAVLDRLWGPQTDDERAADVRTLKAFADNTSKGKEGALRLAETTYFLFYSDLKPDEAAKWASLLDAMYDRLVDQFMLPRGRNIFRGKGLIFVFAKDADYHAMQQAAYRTNSAGTAGMCHGFGNGFVHVAFYRAPDEKRFAHVLVHESVHGFLHRYRTNVHVPSWANEGLAEVIAAELVPNRPAVADRRFRAAAAVKDRGVGGDFFTVRNIAAWQYPVAETFCQFMVQNNPKGYIRFIDGLKDGMEPEQSLAKHYGADPDRIVAAYRQFMSTQPGGK
ncbi:MAG TPA: hypothetical protein VF796_15105 [Humisphaera sp.]